MSQWQPIETVPRDGRQVLFWTPNGGIHIAPAVPQPDRGHLRRLNRDVYIETGEWPNAGWNPTHWMPLPAPPTESA